MTAYLTSFKRWHRGEVDFPDPESLTAYSIAVYQPRWYPELPTLQTFDIRDGGRWTRPADFIPADHNPEEPDAVLLDKYHDSLVGLYWSRRHDPALAPLFKDHVALCCWCPYDKAAQRQLRDYGTFVCHSWAVETVLLSWGVEVVRDDDREWMVA
jgi:hypothetical protein